MSLGRVRAASTLESMNLVFGGLVFLTLFASRPTWDSLTQVAQHVSVWT